MESSQLFKTEADIESNLLTNVCPKIWRRFSELDKEKDDKEDVEKLDAFLDIFQELSNVPFLKTVPSDRVLLLTQACLLLHKPTCMMNITASIYDISLRAYTKLYIDQESDNESEQILNKFQSIQSLLNKFRLEEKVVNPSIVSVVHTEITTYLDTSCKGDFYEEHLATLLQWVNERILGWLQYITSNSNKEQDFLVAVALDETTVDDMNMGEWKQRLEYFVYKLLAEMRVGELFEMIVDYPDSLPGLNDLASCFQRTELRSKLITSLSQALQKRLLHPAVKTDDILTQYVSTIRCLRELDPSGIILENVCAPLKEYLRIREDTIKCIITCLTDKESGPDLAEELFKADSNYPKENESEDGSDTDDEEWQPDPIDANKDPSSKSERTADIINILVNIYGSKEKFVQQYRHLLADRILSNFDYNVVNERRYLELLKCRFGDNSLHNCDIMLKDISDSQRINRHINTEIKTNSQEEPEIDFNAFIVSAPFWPTLTEEDIEPPAYIKDIMERYTSLFEQSKGMRTLKWVDSLGVVQVQIEVEDGETKTFDVTPAQATTIQKFQEQDEWTLSDLSKSLNINGRALRAKLLYWIGQGVIIEKSNDRYVAASTFQSNTHDGSIFESDDEEGDGSASADKKSSQLQVYWSYVLGMLTNMGSLPLERIHSMLNMFALHAEDGSQCTVDEVKTFLQAKVQAGELNFVSGQYKLPK